MFRGLNKYYNTIQKVNLIWKWKLNKIMVWKWMRIWEWNEKYQGKIPSILSSSNKKLSERDSQKESM